MQVKSINTAISVLVAAIIVLTVAIGVWWVSNDTHDTVFKEESNAMENVVKQTMAALDVYIDQNQSMVRMLAQQKVVLSALKWNDPYGADLLFKDLLSSSDNYWAAFVFDKEGQVVAGYNAKGKSLSGADRKSRNYAQAVLQGKTEVFVSDEILISKSGGGIMIFAASAVVRDEAGEIIGGVGLFPKWEVFTSRFVDPFRIGSHGYGFMLDSAGRIIAHGGDRNLLLEDVSDSQFVLDALEQKDGALAYDWDGEQKYMRFLTEPRTGWLVAITTYESDMIDAATSQRNALAIGGGVAALLLTCIMIIIIRKLVTTPVKHVLDYATSVAEGDLQATLEGNHRFEFESLARQIEIMVNELKEKLGFSEGVLNGFSLPCGLIGPDFKVLWTNQHALDLFERDGKPEDAVGLSSGELLFNLPDRETISDRAIKQKQSFDEELEIETIKGNAKNLQITSTPFYDMDGEMLGSLTIWVDVTEIRSQQRLIEEQNERISRAAGEAERISQSLSGAATELLAQIDNASNGSETQRERATETATAMEQMNSTVLEVAQNASTAAEESFTAKSNAEEGAKIVAEVINAVSDVQSQTDGLKQSMEDLGVQASGIGNVLEVITDIADQTNLLALNAAIEAARAGEAGRGFAVVADEVRKLAEKTMDATGEVEQAINTIQGMTRNNVHATDLAAKSVSKSTELANDSGHALQEIVRLVENAADQVQAIATAAEEQSATSEQINRATDEINQISIETSQIMHEAASAIQEVAEMASRLNRVIEEMAAR